MRLPALPHLTRSSALLVAALLLGVPAAHARPSGGVSTGPASPGPGELDAELAGIDEKRVRAAIEYLASPELEGRDSPSRGLELAARYLCERFAAAGLLPAPDSLAAWKRGTEEEPPDWARAGEAGVWLRPYWIGEDGRGGLSRPVPAGCSLELELDGEATSFELGVDFVPVAECEGDMRGELIFGGFGIVERSEQYNDLKSTRVAGKVVLIFDGEPRHKRRFDGEEVSRSAVLWEKLRTLERERVGGVLVVRRPAPGAQDERAGDEEEEPRLSFRYTHAIWQNEPRDRRTGSMPPTLEITPACATRLLGTDALALARKIDKSGRPLKKKLDGRKVSLSSETERGPLQLFNVLGWVPGSESADEVVALGAHYDHIGVGARGRIGHGADDNASGSAALCEIAQALARTKPRRSILLAGFSAEEDGLLGARELVRDLPMPTEQLVAMINLDMIGRGPRNEVVVLGVDPNPGMRDVLKRAQKLGRTGVKKVRECSDRSLFQRSDHYAFHEVKVPTLFLFENYPLEENEDYHTWRDLPALVDMKKVVHTARLALCTTWILANDDDRLPSPRG